MDFEMLPEDLKESVEGIFFLGKQVFHDNCGGEVTWKKAYGRRKEGDEILVLYGKCNKCNREGLYQQSERRKRNGKG